MTDTDIKPTWTVSEYEDSLKDMDICIEMSDKALLFNTVNDYLENLPDVSEKDIAEIVKSAKEVNVLEKHHFKINVDDVIEAICNVAYEDYNMDDTDRVNGIDYVKEFCKKFNEMQTWYTGGKLIAYLDLSQEVKEYYLNKKCISKEVWDETWEKWLRLK